MNVVSDLQKAKNLYNINEQSSINHCYRAIILLDYIIADDRWKTKLKELLRLREAIGSHIVNTSPFATFDQLIAATLQLDCKAYKIVRDIE
ncbi:MAG: hypothetical protein JRI72_13475 [Deltaproteobacteria bacterium]|nr:hypothetical protein [Deltaproteobacteria bacterium]